MIKLYISPHYTGQESDKPDGGIRRVTEAMKKYLPEFGIEVVNSPEEADIINAHGAMPVDKFKKPLVSSCHGLYWAGYDWGSWAHVTNQLVVESMSRAKAVTAPSRWVSKAITRGMLVKPHVIYHGVDTDEFKPDSDPADWVLWNKARVDPISSPEPVNELAAMMSDVRFVSTFGDERDNIKIIGSVPYERMKKIVAKAGIYLATTRETFGIGTLEALACGVPVVGWAFGGQAEIIKQGETGYLVPEGDYEQLQKAVRLALENRDELSKNARQDVIERWQWRDKIQRYARLFEQTYIKSNYHLMPIEKLKLSSGKLVQQLDPSPPKISVIVTNYNLEKYLESCLDSVLNQTFADHECLIVDDCSTDSSLDVIELYNPHKQFHYLETPQNTGLSGARNFGFQHARGKYIIYLDADDMLAPNALEILSKELDKDQSIHIAYGHLDLINDDGSNQRRNRKDGKDLFPPAEFSWRKQLAHNNQIPYAAMMRREVLENSGGYRIRDDRNEDAAFWCRVTSFGYRAKKVTDASTLIYRLRGDSKTAQEMRKYGKEPNWCAWFPWRLADSAKEGRQVDTSRNGEIPDVDIVPFGAQAQPPRRWSRYRRFWNVRHHQNPKISVIIPVGPGHKDYVIDALDSLVAQHFQDWEAIVVNDTGDHWQHIPGAPYATVITNKNKSPEAKGAGEARNVGALAARSGLLLFLDADDYLLPGALDALYEAWESTDGNCVVYGDWVIPKGDKEPEYFQSFDFTCDRLSENVFLRRPIHAVTALYPRWAHEQVGGFNIKMPVWEDWDYLIRMYGDAGLCGMRVPQAIIAYRHNTGQRRRVASYQEADAENHDEIKATNDKMRQFLYNEHKPFYKGWKPMACKKCPDNKIYNQELAQLPQSDFEVLMARNGDGMILEYHGPNRNKIPIKGPASGKTYRTMLTPDGVLIFNVHPQDGEVLKQRTRKGVHLFTEFEPKQPEKKAQPIVSQAPKMPETPVMENDLWADVPVKSTEEKVEREEDPLVFDTVADFREWMRDDPVEQDLYAALVNEKNGKNRVTIVREINQALNG